MPKFATLAVCVETSYRQTSAFVFYRDNRQNAEFGIELNRFAVGVASAVSNLEALPKHNPYMMSGL